MMQAYVQRFSTVVFLGRIVNFFLTKTLFEDLVELYFLIA